MERERCNPEGCGGYLCMRKDPINRSGKECIPIAPTDKKVRIDEKLVTDASASIIVNVCPYGAIHVVNLPEKLSENPLHRYGKNQFELFNAVMPKKGKVMGLIGRNGIGKSTALKILTKKLIPNLGDYDADPDQKRVLAKFSNTALGEYFADLYEGSIKVAYKPQRVELLRDVYSGKVSELLEKADERGVSRELITALDMENILVRNIKDLSGGELQRLAIAGVCARDVDVYYFDEPTSFLDINMRITVARLIMDLAAKGKAVVVVEHDLAVLDYISDEVQIVYGSPATYGIIVQPQAVRAGINEYLEGFISSANMRFRDYQIKFFSATVAQVSKEVLFEYPTINKSYEGFSLEVKPGVVHKGEVMGIMGANGLGKTTFLRLLSGLEKSDDHKKFAYKISCKPQYLEASEGKVKAALEAVSKERMATPWFRKAVLEKLGINKLLDLDLANLSGGELQKVSIARALLYDAPVYAFDEPSAFIDVEDRVKVAEVIKDFVFTFEKCAMVVDHDVQFVDHVADSLLVFEGEPSKFGSVVGPLEKKEGLNLVLKALKVTYRRDHENGRARINKEGSVLDREQKKSGEYYSG